MSRKIIGLALGAMLFALSVPAQAQQPKKVPRIGILFIGSRNQPHLESFKQGLGERGYTEGELAAELVQLKVDVIVVTADISAEAAKQATTKIPIVVTT